MNSQSAYRIAHAMIRHGDSFAVYLREFADTGYCPTAEFLFLCEERLAIGLSGHDLSAFVLTRDQARKFVVQIEQHGRSAIIDSLLKTAGDVKVVTNDIVDVMSRPTLIHTKCGLHSSKRTAKAKIARVRGFAKDAARAAEFNKGCSKPSMMSSGKHQDKLPVTLHSVKPIGANV